MSIEHYSNPAGNDPALVQVPSRRDLSANVAVAVSSAGNTLGKKQQLIFLPMFTLY